MEYTRSRSSEENIPARDSISERLWREAERNEAAEAEYSPFFTAMATRDLDSEKFLGFIRKRSLLLPAFRDVCLAAPRFASSYDRDEILEFRNAFVKESTFLKSFVEENNVAPKEEIVVDDHATSNYINFLEAASQVKDEEGNDLQQKNTCLAVAVCSLIPCTRLYAHLSRKIIRLLGYPHGYVWTKWLLHFESHPFEKKLPAERLLDKLTSSMSSGELRCIEKIYSRAMELEIDFLYAQPVPQLIAAPLTELEVPTKRVFLFTDFDLTCSVIDSSTILARSSIRTAAGDTFKQLSLAPKGIPERNSWPHLAEQYTEQYGSCIKDILFINRVSSEFDYNSLLEILALLSDFEKYSNSRIIYFQGLKGLQFMEIRNKVLENFLYDECTEFFHRVVEKKDKPIVNLHILSDSWCGHIVRSAFYAAGLLEHLTVHSNELKFKDSTSTGEMERKIVTPHDKLNVFLKIWEECKIDEEDDLVICIGDSVADLPFLLQAHVGIVLGSSTSLMRVGEHFGITFRPLHFCLLAKHLLVNAWKERLSGVLFTASGWTEIQAFLLGATSLRR